MTKPRNVYEEVGATREGRVVVRDASGQIFLVGPLDEIERLDDDTAYRLGRRLKVGDLMRAAHERGEACGRQDCLRCRAAMDSEASA